MSQILDGEAVGDRMIGTAVNMLDTHLPAMLSVVYGNEELVDPLHQTARPQQPHCTC